MKIKIILEISEAKAEYIQNLFNILWLQRRRTKSKSRAKSREKTGEDFQHEMMFQRRRTKSKSRAKSREKTGEDFQHEMMFKNIGDRSEVYKKNSFCLQKKNTPFSWTKERRQQHLEESVALHYCGWNVSNVGKAHG
jgi:hypothetical protein